MGMLFNMNETLRGVLLTQASEIYEEWVADSPSTAQLLLSQVPRDRLSFVTAHMVTMSLNDGLFMELMTFFGENTK